MPPVAPVRAQPAQRIEWAANKDAGRLHEDTLFGGVETPVTIAGRSQRVRKQAVQYTNTGASTRKRRGASASDAVDAVAGILASPSDPAAVQDDARSTEEKHPEQARKVAKRQAPNKERIKEVAAQRREIELANLSRLKTELLLTKSWLDRKEMAFLAYATALAEGKPKMQAYEAAAKAAFVSDRTVQSWPYKVNGHNVSIPRAMLCVPDCVICMQEYEKYGKVGSPNYDRTPRVLDSKVWLLCATRGAYWNRGGINLK